MLPYRYRWLGASLWLVLALFLSLGLGVVADSPLTLNSEPHDDCPTRTTSAPIPAMLGVVLQRPNAPPPDPSWAVPVTLALYPPGDPDTICRQWDLTLNQNGQWQGYLDIFFSGLYDVRIRNLHTLPTSSATWTSAAR